MSFITEDECLLAYINGDKPSAISKLESFIKSETSFGGEVSENGARAYLSLSELALFQGDMYGALGLLNQARDVLDSKITSPALMLRVQVSRAAILKLQGLEQEASEIFKSVSNAALLNDKDSFFTYLKLIHFAPDYCTHAHAHTWYESLKLHTRIFCMLSPYDTFAMAQLLAQGLEASEACDVLEVIIEKLDEQDPLYIEASQFLKELENIHSESFEAEELFSQNQVEAFKKSLVILKTTPFIEDRIRLYSLVGDSYLSENKLSEAFEIFNEAEDLILQSKRMREPESAGFIFHNLSLLYGEQGNFKAALSRMEHALDIRKSYFDADHPAITESQNALTIINERLNNDTQTPVKNETNPLKQKISSAISMIKAGKIDDAEGILTQILDEF